MFCLEGNLNIVWCVEVLNVGGREPMMTKWEHETFEMMGGMKKVERKDFLPCSVKKGR